MLEKIDTNGPAHLNKEAIKEENKVHIAKIESIQRILFAEENIRS